MTKREHDKLTRENWRYTMASDERDGYRMRRCLPLRGLMPRDRLAERAHWRRRNPHLATLALGSPLRGPTEWRLMGRFPRLPLTREERAYSGASAAAGIRSSRQEAIMSNAGHE